MRVVLNGLLLASAAGICAACGSSGDDDSQANQSGSGGASASNATSSGGVSGGQGQNGSAGNGGGAGQGAGPNGSSGKSGSGSGGASGGSGSGGLSGGSGGANGAGSGGSGGSSANNPGDVARVDNPYADAKGYINPEWQAKAMAESGGDRIANTPTAVWIDRIAAIEGTTGSMSNGPMGVSDHLDAALEQGAGYIQFVIYDLPGRDCAALASNGELGPDDLPRYKSEYIDAIAAIMGDAKYRSLRIINIIEVDSLPNLVTNTNVAACATMKQNGGYVDGVAYALKQLGSLPNTYNYVDAGHHAWLGWDSNFGPSAQQLKEVADKAGITNVHGFITNSANYSPLTEPHFTGTTMVGGTSVGQSKWVGFNPYVDELTFAKAFRQKLVDLGFDASIGMLIDTSRNGWGGSARPQKASSATDVDTFVNESRVDRRVHAGNWCNQSGAGLGERPRAAPEAGIDAYVWIKPPGESDGASMEVQNSDGKGFDRMCDPTYGGNERNGNSATGALPNAPLAGAWFSAQFQELMKNAYPAL
jgi:cellulose 1,4-beta-cellobiosidase